MAKSTTSHFVSYFIAFRHLASQHNRGFVSFITLIAVIGVMLGVASLIITLSILDGFQKTIRENVVGFTAHIQVFGFQNQLLPNPERAQQTIRQKFPEVTDIAPFLAREGMVRSTSDIDGVMIKGVDPIADISAARRRLVEGEYDLAEKDSGLQTMIIGKRLAEKLRTTIGDRVLVYSLGGASVSLAETRIMQFRVAGIYETGMADYDGSFVYINLRNAQRLFQVGKSVSGFDLLAASTEKLELLARQIPEDLGYPYYARSMFQMYRNLFTWIELQRKPIPIILGLIIIVATVNIVGTLLMMVMEKSRQIGILRAMGIPRKALLRIFLAQGMLVGFVGTAFGNVFALVLCWLEMRYRFFPLPSGIYFMTHVPIELSWWTFFLVSGAALIMCFLASIVPARVAARISPISMLRFES